jgi:hypothetical protein
MPTPKAGYYAKDGKRVPSVSTICSRFKESGGLIHWSWQTAHEPLMQARALLEQVREHGDTNSDVDNFLARPLTDFDYRAKRDTAMNAGTVAHEMVECFIRKHEFDPTKHDPALVEMAKPAYAAFREWSEQSHLEIGESEVPLVSERYRFGGTRDAVAVGKKRALLDWKTSNAIYPEYLCQLAAYGILDEEHGNTIEGGYHLLRFSKQEQPDDPVQFVHYRWDQLNKPAAAFLSMRELYSLMQEIERFAK